LDILVDFDEHPIVEMVVEDPDYFAKTLFDLYEAFDAAEGQWVASIDAKPATLDKNLYTINDYYFMLNPSKSRTVSNALFKQVVACAQNADHIERTQELLALVEQYGLGLVEELGFDFEVSTDESFDVSALIKALGLRIFLNTENLVARTIEFCDVLQALTGINHFVLVNVAALMGVDNLAALIREMGYHDHRALLLSSVQAPCSVPQRIIVSEDLAVL
jgi:CRISPR type II-A-associated protein Csn2